MDIQMPSQEKELKPTWQIIYEVAKSLNNNEFKVDDIVEIVNKKNLNIKEASIRSHIIGMAPNHPSSIHQPFLRDNYPVFNYLGGGRYCVSEEKNLKLMPKKELYQQKTIIIDESPVIIDVEKLGDFYILISSFEKDIRELIKEKLGKGIYRRLRKDMPDTISQWEKRMKADKNWGISPEKDLISYALLTDYMDIIKKYKKMFTISGDEELNTVLNQLKQFATFGRNPIMHCRTLTLQKYYTTISSVNYLKEWVRRIQQ